MGCRVCFVLLLKPIQSFWARLCARFWNKSSSPNAPTLVRGILLNDLALFKKGSDTCWSAKFLTCMARANTVQGGKSVSELRLMDVNDILRLKFSETSVVEALDKVYKSFWGDMDGDPRTAESRGVALIKYDKWFASESNLHLGISAPEMHMRALFKFRLGASDLRAYDHSIEERSNMICLLCRNRIKEIEDEKHVIFRCARYKKIRNDRLFSVLYTRENRGHMNMFMNQQSQYLIAHLLYTILKKRQSALETINLDMFSSDSEDSE